MAQQNISQGRPPIVWSTVDDAFQKINANFTELYLSIGGSGVDLTNIASSLIPDTNESRDLGSIDKRWRDLYLSSSSIYLGNALITADEDGKINLPEGSTVGGTLIKDPIESSFKTIRVSGQNDIIADDATDTLNFSGIGISITTDDITDTITFRNIGIVTATAGTGISVSGTNPLIVTNTGVTSLSGTVGQIGVSSSTGSITLTNLGVTRLSTDPGSGITLSQDTGDIQITNSAPNVVQDVFKNIAVSGQTTLVPTGPNTTLNVSAGNGIAISTFPTVGLETLTIANTGIISISVDSSLTYSLGAGAASLALAATISRNLTGNVTGNLTGNVTGNLTGNVTGNVVGDLKGSVVADDSTMIVDGVSGEVVGDVNTSRLRTSETKIALGTSAGETTQGADTVAVGNLAGRTNQAANGVAIGALSGVTNQGAGAVAVGSAAGNTGQGFSGVAIGYAAGGASQGQRGIAIGDQAGATNQGDYAVAIGSLSGGVSQGANSIAIGQNAGVGGTNANSIILNATGLALTSAAAGFYVDPIREVTGPQVLYYDPTGTKEITWGPIPSGTGGGGGGEIEFELNVASDDSTLRRINSGETLKFIGGTGITTSSDGEGAITISAAAVSGLASRSTAAGSTGSIANAATANVTVTGFKGYLLYKIQTSAAAWVRIYTSTAARTADSGRAEGVDPSPGAGVIAEVITTGAETILITPGAIGFNDESPVDTDIKLAVTNKSGAPADITVTLTVVKVED